MCHGLGALQVHRLHQLLYDTYEPLNYIFDLPNILMRQFLSIGNADDQKYGNTKRCLVFGTYP